MKNLPPLSLARKIELKARLKALQTRNDVQMYAQCEANRNHHLALVYSPMVKDVIEDFMYRDSMLEDREIMSWINKGNVSKLVTEATMQLIGAMRNEGTKVAN